MYIRIGTKHFYDIRKYSAGNIIILGEEWGISIMFEGGDCRIFSARALSLWYKLHRACTDRTPQDSSACCDWARGTFEARFSSSVPDDAATARQLLETEENPERRENQETATCFHDIENTHQVLHQKQAVYSRLMGAEVPLVPRRVRVREGPFFPETQ